MKKILLALAVTGAFVAPVAMADTSNVTLYGAANVSYTHATNGDNALSVNGTSTNQVTSEASHIGLRGSEDLGGGTSAIWQVETLVNIDNSTAGGAGAGSLGTRNTFAGLKGGFGTLVLGKNDPTIKTAFMDMDMFADTVADYRSILGHIGNYSFDNRIANSATYASPDMSGFKVSVQVGAGAEGATGSLDKKGTITNLAAAYNAGPISAAIAWSEVKLGSSAVGGNIGATDLSSFALNGGALAADDKLSAWRLGGGYKMDQFAINAIYEHVKSDIASQANGGDANRANTFYLAGKLNISASDALKAAYTRRGNSGTGAAEIQNSGVKQFSLGYDHAMSKRTALYAVYTKVNNDAAAQMGLSDPDASSVATNSNGAGADPSAFAIGMKHSF